MIGVQSGIKSLGNYLTRHSSTPPEELVSACANSGDASAWEEFVHRFHPLIATVALRTARQWGNPGSQLIDDLVQETYLKLCAGNCRLLRNFKSQHPGAIFGFLKIVTANVVHDYFKASHAVKRGAGEAAEQFDGMEHSVTLAARPVRTEKESIDLEILLRQIDACLTRLIKPEELARSRQVFWLYYRCGLSASAIASLPSLGLSTKGVESTLLRLSRLVKDAIAVSKCDTKGSQDTPSIQKGLGPAGSF